MDVEQYHNMPFTYIDINKVDIKSLHTPVKMSVFVMGKKLNKDKLNKSHIRTFTPLL